ncbi:HIT family protein [Caldisericum exile]|uniref:HIT family protein n=1 Tax=Caldisericum exile (strain DSM 21853 / NBRC 104410 / AZM16c01) TaxID=511051 RepID=A0A7U6GFP6_CALEA|nr:HIT domain-containing protein [Caldisericum exile]BAL81549.1 HIT family protein [Caldisericum exile AZM16c01]
MRNLFAPWRKTYIQNAHKKDRDCFICVAANSLNDEESLVVKRGNFAIIILNRYPYNSGHVMICPKRHIKFPYELNEDEQKEIMQFLGLAVKMLENVYHPEGFNIGVNIGRAAGAGEEHLHFHVVPRWGGDTNFMSVFGETRVIPETIEETYKKLKEEFNKA